MTTTMFPLKNLPDKERQLLQSKSQQNLKLPFKSLTYTGQSFDVLKSALQKSIRRGIFEDVMWCVREIHLLCNLEECPNKDSKARMTNMLNRLACCAIEDVSPRDYISIDSAFSYLSQYTRWHYANILCLAKAAEILRRALKGRVCSHLEAVAANRTPIVDDDDANEKHFIQALETGSRWECACYLGAVYKKHMGLASNELISSKPRNNHMNRKMNFLKWFCPIIESEYEHDGKLLSNKCTEEIHVFIFRASIERRLNFFKGRPYFKEQFKILISIIESIIMFKICPIVDIENICKISFDNYSSIKYDMTENTSNFYWPSDHHSINQPDYVYDLHTRKGDNSIEKFIKEGSWVENPDENWINSDWKSEYEAIKLTNYNQIVNKKKKRQMDSFNSSLKSLIKKPKLNDITNFISGNLTLEKDVCSQSILFTPDSRKTPVFAVKMKNDEDYWVVKEMKATFNYGLDQLLAYNLKKKLGLAVPEGNGGLFYCNFMYCRKLNRVVETEEKVICFCTKMIQNCSRLTHIKDKAKRISTIENKAEELLSIISFRAILGVTDTNFSNILCDSKRLYSVDENSIGSKSVLEIIKCTPVKNILKHIPKEKKMIIPTWISNPETKDILGYEVEKFNIDPTDILKNFDFVSEKFIEVVSSENCDPTQPRLQSVVSKEVDRSSNSTSRKRLTGTEGAEED